MADNHKPADESLPEKIVRGAAVEVASGLSGKVYMLVAVGLMAFSSVFLLIGWQFGPLPIIEAQQYKKFTGHVDAKIVESWLALEFDSRDIPNPEFWRASTNASRCVVAEYDGEWGAPIRRAFCGTRVPFNGSYLLADLRDVSPDVPFAWARDARGFVVPEMRMAPSTVQWLKANQPNRFMHDKWPAKDALDWLRLELDRPVDAAIYGWTAPAPILPLVFDPAKPGEALPAGIVAKRLDAGWNLPAVIVGFGIGLFIWFKAMAFVPLLANLAPWGRWVLSALPLLTLPWWMDAFPTVLSHFNRQVASVIGDMFADIGRLDRMIATEPGEATLANGERLVWTVSKSVYADTFGAFKFVPPGKPLASTEAAQAALTETITNQVPLLNDAERGDLFVKLARDKAAGLDAVAYVFKPAAEDTAADNSASTETRRAAAQFLQ
ncbi:MAG: hypothetical protein ABI607_11550 [Betaproteobacteria bacterium]